MQRMLDPRTIAVIGASEAEGSVGRTIMDNVMRSADRTVYPVNPKHKTVMGLAAFPDVGAVPAEVDLAVIATPAATVPGIMEQCVAAGVRGAIIVSAGFAETGKEGAALAAQIRKALRGSSTRVIGPNCLGIIRPERGAERVVSRHPARAGQHRADLAVRCAGHWHARLGDRRARRVLAVRLGRRDARRRLRRPDRLPRRRRADAQHPHLHGDDRRRAALHQRGTRIRAQQADHRAQARPLRRERRARRSPTPARWPAATRSTRRPSGATASCACTRSPTSSTPPRCSTPSGSRKDPTSQSSPTRGASA